MPDVAGKLRKLADGMDAQIQAKRFPSIANQNLTPRRIRIAQHMGREADRLALGQAVLRRLAVFHENPATVQGLLLTIDPEAHWEKLTSKAAVLALRTDVLERIAGDTAPLPDPKAAIKKLEMELVGMKIPGFFPTPMDTGRQMAELASLAPGMRVIEPSAGKGDLAEAILETEPDVVLEVGEISSRLRDILTAKGFTVRPEFDCLEIPFYDYDRIIQNPPFENGLDITHTMGMFERLKPGGRLVGIVSEGPFFRNDLRAVQFREWIKGKLVEEVKLPSGTFTGKDAFRQTGVASRILVLDKPLA